MTADPACLLVFGTRTFYDFNLLARVLDDEVRGAGPLVVVTGDAPGADALARLWAKFRGHEIRVFDADWSAGPSAGPRRNARMVAAALAFDRRWAVGFWDGFSRGTRDTADRCRAAGIPTGIVRYAAQ
jgi:hypothetical protein